MIKKIPGILLCSTIGIISWLSAKFIPIGSVTISVLLGIIIGNIFKLPQQFSSGVSFSEKKILTWAIAITGIKLDYKILSQLGISTLFIIVAGIFFTVSTAILLGRKFRINKDLTLLIGIGNAVCGSSAIAAAQGVIKTDEKNVGLSIATINFLGTIGIFLLPLLSVFILRLNDLHAGILTGNTLQAIGQVSAAGFSINEKAGETAVIVKMCRILMITPLVIFLSLLQNHKSNNTNLPVSHNQINNQSKKGPKIPMYIIAFILFSILGSLHIVPEQIIPYIKTASKIMLTIAMAGIGIRISLKDLAGGGKNALLLGVGVWSAQIIFSVILILLFSIYQF